MQICTRKVIHPQNSCSQCICCYLNNHRINVVQRNVAALLMCAHLIHEETASCSVSTAIPSRRAYFPTKSIASRSDKKRARQTACPFFVIEFSPPLVEAGLVFSCPVPGNREIQTVLFRRPHPLRTRLRVRTATLFTGADGGITAGVVKQIHRYYLTDHNSHCHDSCNTDNGLSDFRLLHGFTSFLRKNAFSVWAMNSLF